MYSKKEAMAIRLKEAKRQKILKQVTEKFEEMKKRNEENSKRR
jgi:hypothetical protein